MLHLPSLRLLRSGLAVASALLLLVATAAQDAEKPPSSRETDALLAEYVALDHRTEDGMARGDAILARLALLPPQKASRMKSWRKKLDKFRTKGPELPKEPGRHYLWEEPERGLYILGGNTKKPQGLFIGMHGGGVGSGDAGSSHGAYDAVCAKVGWLGIFPEVLENTERGWTDSGTEEFVLELVGRALRTWEIDRDQVYFGGHSMGGYGTWTLGGHHADLVAGLIPSAGAPTPYMNHEGKIVDIDDGIVPNLRNTSIVIYQSDDDPRVPPDANRFAAKKLARAQAKWGGFDFEYWEVSGRGHGPPPGGYQALADKIRAKRRSARPDVIVWQQVLPWKRQFYWLGCDAPATGALIEAELDRKANKIRVTAEGKATGLHVLLDEALVDCKRDVVVLFNGAEVYRGRPEPTLAALVATGAGGDDALTFTTRVPLGD